MAFIRMCILIILSYLLLSDVYAQSVFYPVHSSRLLKSTVQDAAMLFQQAINSSQFSPSNMPQCLQQELYLFMIQR